MARPPKKGLDYFPLDQDFYHDRKIRRVLKSCGPASGTVLTCLLGNIYHENGYYIRWDQDLPFDISDLLGVSEGQVQEIIKAALKAKFFDEEKYNQYQILTSTGIQKRYLNALTDLRRSRTHLNKDYWLLDEGGESVDNSISPKLPVEPKNAASSGYCNNLGVIPEETPSNREETPQKHVDNPQTKLKETKEKKSKLKETNAEKDISSINKFVRGFENRFKLKFSRDNLSALKNSVIAHRDDIEREYRNLEIFFRTILMRLDDIRKSKDIKSPINFFFAGAFTARYLWSLTAQEEEVGSGYHKPMIKALEQGKSPITGLKEM